jgi:hypothetical protein
LFNVLTTVQLDEQLRGGAAEVDDKSVERHLSPKLQAKLMVAELEPEATFGIGLLPAQPTHNFDR